MLHVRAVCDATSSHLLVVLAAQTASFPPRCVGAVLPLSVGEAPALLSGVDILHRLAAMVMLELAMAVDHGEDAAQRVLLRGGHVRVCLLLQVLPEPAVDLNMHAHKHFTPMRRPTSNTINAQLHVHGLVALESQCARVGLRKFANE